MTPRRPPVKDWPLIDLAGQRCPRCDAPVSRHIIEGPWRSTKEPLQIRSLGGGFWCDGTDLDPWSLVHLSSATTPKPAALEAIGFELVPFDTTQENPR